MVEQAPSGISLFFAVALFLAAVIIFFSAGEGITSLSVILGISFVMLGGAFVWLVAYGGGAQEVNLPETTAHKLETTAEKTTSASGRAGQSQAGSTAYENYCIEKQFAEATRGMGGQQAIDYESAIISEAIARGVDPRTVLTERGFPC